MLTRTRPGTSAEAVLICWTKNVGEISPDRQATMNLIFSVRSPMATASAKGSGRVNPMAISIDSMPHVSAWRQVSTSWAKSTTPGMLVVACALRNLSPA